MLWNWLPTIRTTDKVRKNPPRSSSRPRLEGLEDRTLPTALTFVVDPALSSLTLSASLGTTPLQEQGAGSLVTSYSGTLATSYDPANSTLQFNAAGTNLVANNSGSWQPLADGSSGHEPANYGGQVQIMDVTARGAIREFAGNITTASAVPVDSGGDFPADQLTLTSTTGHADYNAGHFGSGTTSLAGHSASNAATANGHIGNNPLGSVAYDLTVPIDVTVTSTVLGMPATFRLQGTIVAHTHFPVAREDFSCFQSIDINVDIFTFVFRGDLVTTGVLPDQTPFLHDPSTNPFATPGHTPIAITTVLDAQGNTDLTFIGDPRTPLLPGVYHIGLHDSTSGPPKLQLLTIAGTSSTTHQMETLPAPSVVANPLHGSRFQWITVAFNYGPTPDDQSDVMFWNTPVPVGEAPNVNILNYSNTTYWKSNIRVGDATRGLYLIYGGPPIEVAPSTGAHYGIRAPLTVTAGAAVSFTVSARDGENNTINSYNGTVHFTSSDPHAVLPPDYTFTPADQGAHTFTILPISAGGFQAIMVSGSEITGLAIEKVTPAAADHFVVMAPATAASGTPFDVRIVAVDAYGNIDTNYAGTVHFSSTDSDPGVVLPPDGMLTSPEQVTLITPGDQTITVTDLSSGITGSAIVTVM